MKTIPTYVLFSFITVSFIVSFCSTDNSKTVVHMYLCHLSNGIPVTVFEFNQILSKNIFKVIEMYFVGYHEITHELLERMPDILLKNELSYTGVKGLVKNIGF